MPLTAHDWCILHLAARSPEGCLTFYIEADGSIALLGKDQDLPLLAEDSLPRLEQLGLLILAVNRSYFLTPKGWDEVRETERIKPISPLAEQIGA